MQKSHRSTCSANGPASCDSDSTPPSPPREGSAAEHAPDSKDGTRKKTTSDAKTLWVKTFRCFECGKCSHKMPKCRQCSQAYYCGADCQRKHWPKHKRSCKAAVAALAQHAHRERLARAVREKSKAKMESTEDDNLCVICQAKPVDPVELPCGHEYCKACVEELRKKGVDKSCPLCRKPLPPGPEKLLQLGLNMYLKIEGAIDRSRPGVDPQTPWPALWTEQQGEMDQAVAMLREAADQGHMIAQAACADLYGFGKGVAKDDRLAFVYHEKAAQQGDRESQYNTGIRYQDGLGCEQSDERAAEWFQKAGLQGHFKAQYNTGVYYRDGLGRNQSDERAAEWFQKAALQGDANAQQELGCAYEHGRGVPQSDEKAFELYSQSAAQGDPLAQNSLAVCYEVGRGCKQSFERAAELVRQSAAQGTMDAQYNLAVFYAKGIGVPQNLPEARRLFALASAQGCTGATEALWRIDEAIRNDQRLALTRATMRKKPKPNAPCSCGSGKKHRKCCGAHGRANG